MQKKKKRRSPLPSDGFGSNLWLRFHLLLRNVQYFPIVLPNKNDGPMVYFTRLTGTCNFRGSNPETAKNSWKIIHDGLSLWLKSGNSSPRLSPTQQSLYLYIYICMKQLVANVPAASSTSRLPLVSGPHWDLRCQVPGRFKQPWNLKTAGGWSLKLGAMASRQKPWVKLGWSWNPYAESLDGATTRRHKFFLTDSYNWLTNFTLNNPLNSLLGISLEYESSKNTTKNGTKRVR